MSTIGLSVSLKLSVGPVKLDEHPGKLNTNSLSPVSHTFDKYIPVLRAFDGLLNSVKTWKLCSLLTAYWLEIIFVGSNIFLK